MFVSRLHCAFLQIWFTYCVIPPLLASSPRAHTSLTARRDILRSPQCVRIWTVLSSFHIGCPRFLPLLLLLPPLPACTCLESACFCLYILKTYTVFVLHTRRHERTCVPARKHVKTLDGLLLWWMLFSPVVSRLGQSGPCQWKRPLHDSQPLPRTHTQQWWIRVGTERKN